MRTRILLLCVCVVSYLYSVAQPTNNPCGAAELISSLNGSCDMGNTVDLATEDIGPSACTVGANENVWFYFVATGVSVEVAEWECLKLHSYNFQLHRVMREMPWNLSA